MKANHACLFEVHQTNTTSHGTSFNKYEAQFRVAELRWTNREDLHNKLPLVLLCVLDRCVQRCVKGFAQTAFNSNPQ